MSETLVSTLARKWRLDVNTGSTASPTWTQVRAMAEFTPGIDSNLEDDSDYDSDGWGSQAKTSMQWSLAATFIRKVGVTTGNYDPGQERIRQSADAFGPDAVVHVRWYDREGGPEAYEGFAIVSWEPQGGDVNALDRAAVTLTGQGARTEITNPTP